MSFLERIRQKPRAVRTQYAFFTSLMVTGLVAVVWLTSLPERFNQAEIATTESAESAQTFSEFSQVFSAARDTVANTIDSVRDLRADPETVQGPADALLLPEEPAVPPAKKESSAAGTAPAQIVLISTTTSSSSLGE